MRPTGIPRPNQQLRPRNRILFVLLVLVCLWPQALAAQVDSPSMGALFDPEAGLVLAVPGIPGVARVGAALDLGRRIEAAAYSPNRDYVLAAPESESGFLIVDSDGIQPVGTLDAFGRIELSPSGNFAALLDTTGRRLVVVSGLPDRPEVVVREWLPAYHGIPASVAISDQGLVVTGYTSGAVLSLEAGVRTRRPAFNLVGSFGSITDVAFLVGRSDLLVADDGLDALFLIEDVDTQPTRKVIADRSNGIDRPMAVAASEDGARFFLADAGAKAVIVGGEDADTGEVACGCTPTTLVPLQGSSVFALTLPVNDSPVWMLNGGIAPMAIQTAPVAREAEE